MSFFQDDFYSTDVRRPKRWRSFQRGRTLSTATNTAVFLVLIGLGLIGINIFLYGMSSPPEEQAAADRWMMYNDKMVEAVDHALPAIVTVINQQESEIQDDQVNLGIGSGVIFQKSRGKAYVVTNFHVIEEGNQFEIVLSSGERKMAELVGKDRLTDLAVLEMSSAGIEAEVDFGRSRDIKAGQIAIAIGNPLGAYFPQTTTMGVISYPLRTIPISLSGNGSKDWEMDVIQTDAAINQGNSGGALLNLEGEVIGINSMKISSWGIEGIGFAIPAHTVKPVIEELMEHGYISRPFFGVAADALPLFVQIPEDQREGFEKPVEIEQGIVLLLTAGPAEEAGLRKHDVVIQVDDTEISSMLELRRYLYDHKKVGEKMIVHYYRGQEKHKTTVILGESKPEE